MSINRYFYSSILPRTTGSARRFGAADDEKEKRVWKSLLKESLSTIKYAGRKSRNSRFTIGCFRNYVLRVHLFLLFSAAQLYKRRKRETAFYLVHTGIIQK